MKKFFNRILCVFLVLSLLPVAAFASQKPAEPEDDEYITVIVEVKGDAVLESQTAKDLGYKNYLNTNEAKAAENKMRSVQSKVQSEIKSTVKEDTPVLFTYTHTFNGFALRVNKSDIAKIRALPNVENVYMERIYQTFEGEEKDSIATAEAEENPESEPYMNFGSEMMDLEYLHDLGYTGKGLVIAVVDSAFDVNHIMFSEPIENPRLSKSDIADLIKNNSLSVCNAGATLSVNRVYRSEKIPFAFNYGSLSADTYFAVSDHGTHVAGIAAGNHGVDIFGNTFIGAAPDAQLLLMACTAGIDSGSLNSAALLAGMEDAVKLGADVINCSFGGAYVDSTAPEIKAVNAARNAGIMVAVAAGNFSRGNESAIPAELIDYSALPTPADISASTSVASADSTKYHETFYAFTVEGEEFYFTSMNDEVFFSDALKDKDYEYAYAGKSLESDYENLDVSGKVVLVEHGDIKWWQKALNAQNAGAVGMVVLFESLDISMTQSELVHIPVATVLDTNREKLLYAAEKKMTVLDGLQKRIATKPKTQMSYFSSWDTERTLELKPEITAPGGSILSSYNDDRFELMSGTSMATPFFAGATALLMGYIEANTDKYSQQGNRVMLLENLFMSTANVVMQDTENNIPYSPRLQGAGLANARKAATTPAILLGDEFTADSYTYRKSKISLREIKLDNDNAFSLNFTVRNLTNSPVTYDKLSMTVITDDADEDGYITDMRKLAFSDNLPESVTVPANSDVALDIKVTLDKEYLDENMGVFTNGFYIDGYVFLDNDDENTPMLNIPFTGFYGDWASQPALDGYIFDDNVLSGTYLYTLSKHLPNGSPTSDGEIVPLGLNLFDKDNDDLSAKEYAGVSPNFDSEADAVAAVFTPLRMVGKTDFAICDTDGKEIMRKTDGTEGNYYYAKKYSSSSLRFYPNELSDLPDGDYVFKIYAGFRYKEPYVQNETIEMPFYIDRKAPTISDFSISEDGSELDITVSDNRYLMGIVVYGESNGEYTCATYPVMPQKEYTTTIDISEFEKDSVAVAVFDYAYNSTWMSDCPPEFVFNGRNGTEFSFTVHNFSGKEIPCTLVLGLYLKGNLVGLTSKEETIKSGTSHKYFNLDCDVYDTVKLFTWENFKSMKPICNNFEF